MGDNFLAYIPVMIVVLLALATGMGMGWLIGQRSKPAIGSIDQNKKDQFDEIAILWKDKKSGKHAIEAGGQMGTSMDTFKAENVTNILTALKDLALINGRSVDSQLEVKENPAKPQDGVLPPMDQGIETTTGQVSGKSKINISKAVPPVSTPGADPKTPSQVINTPIEISKPISPGSIVMQIDQILQGMLQGSGLEKKGIRLTEDVNSGVIVWIGLQRFDGIDSVNDPDVQAIIKKAASAWEKSSSHR